MAKKFLLGFLFCSLVLASMEYLRVRYIREAHRIEYLNKVIKKGYNYIGFSFSTRDDSFKK